jgi:hypothetical protein
MALRGNLRDFTVTQLLNLINLARKTGTLILDGPSDQAYVAFRDGKLAYARIGNADGRLATILHQANKLSPNQYRALGARAGSMSDKELGLLLVKPRITGGYLRSAVHFTNMSARCSGGPVRFDLHAAAR